MGLTIHWTLQSNARGPAPARALLGQLRQRALDLPFQEVGDLVELTGEAADFHHCEPGHPHRWLLIQAGQYVEHGGRSLHVLPRQVMAFSISPGAGCEQANFGLCRYPARVEVEEGEAYVPSQGFIRQRRQVATGLCGWTWASFCKTQYASDPQCGGTENFLRCHLALVALLDFARSLGILAHVSDEGEYWEKRDAQALAASVGEWNEMIAAFAGRFQDALGRPNVVAPITDFPNFERLEARGRAGE